MDKVKILREAQTDIKNEEKLTEQATLFFLINGENSFLIWD